MVCMCFFLQYAQNEIFLSVHLNLFGIFFNVHAIGRYLSRVWRCIVSLPFSLFGIKCAGKIHTRLMLPVHEYSCVFVNVYLVVQMEVTCNCLLHDVLEPAKWILQKSLQESHRMKWWHSGRILHSPSIPDFSRFVEKRVSQGIRGRNARWWIPLQQLLQQMPHICI